MENLKKAKILYHNIGNNLSGKEKLLLLKENTFKQLDFERIKPDAKGNWINQTDNDWQTLIPICAKDKKDTIFKMSCLGVSTNRDEWVYDFSKENLEKKIKFFIEKYNEFLDKNDTSWDTSIKWSETLKAIFTKKQKLTFSTSLILKAHYRPFTTQFYYAERNISDRLTQNHYPIFGEEDNLAVIFSNSANRKPFFCLSSVTIPNINFNGDPAEYVTLYRYENGVKVENISDWALSLFQNHYTTSEKVISKLDIFHYVYGVLHSPVYRLAYEQNLKRDFPRIPLYADFWQYAVAGEGLMALHLDYDKTQLFSKEAVVKHLPLESMLPKRKKTETDMFGNNESEKEDAALLLKLKPAVYLKKTKENIIEIDQLTSISSIPALAWEYKLGNRSAIEWVLDQYKPYKSTDKTIQDNFNNYDFADYKEEVISLLLQVIHISVETMKIVKSL